MSIINQVEAHNMGDFLEKAAHCFGGIKIAPKEYFIEEDNFFNEILSGSFY